MPFFLDPYKNRAYNQIVGNWEEDTIEAYFDEGVFVHDEESGAIGLWAYFTAIYPEVTRKFKPEEFNLSYPVLAMILFHYKDYEVNSKNDQKQWVTNTFKPTWFEIQISNYLIDANLFNTPLKGSLILNNQQFFLKQAKTAFEKDKETFIPESLGLEEIEKLEVITEIPRINKPKNQVNNNYSQQITPENIQNILEKRQSYAKSFLTDLLIEVPPFDWKEFIEQLSKADPQKVELAYKLLSIIMR